uniref:Uncharacterized protein n=1 Tax=Cajanus cajan TaxID=3821 RepID=A0A151TIS2_CAJCA|nr:hypothetical protein KK1_013262 [Cajanus cajan]
MGNRSGGFRLLGNGHSFYRIELGEAATISMKKRGIKLDEKTHKMTQTWEVLYNVQGVISTFSITNKTTETNSDEELDIKIEDYTHGIETDIAMYGETNYVTVRKAEAGLFLTYIVGQNLIDFSSGRLEFNVDGPVEHPSSALFHMIEEATGTGTWKPTACPHCVNVQRQSDESEDSDSSLRAPRQSHGSLQSIGNRGRVNGDANGSFFQGNKIKFVKRWI